MALVPSACGAADSGRVPDRLFDQTPRLIQPTRAPTVIIMTRDVLGPFLARLFCMPDDTKRDEPVPFPVEVTVNGVKVTVTLMLKPGTTVTQEARIAKPGRSKQ